MNYSSSTRSNVKSEWKQYNKKRKINKTQIHKSKTTRIKNAHIACVHKLYIFRAFVLLHDHLCLFVGWFCWLLLVFLSLSMPCVRKLFIRRSECQNTSHCRSWICGAVRFHIQSLYMWFLISNLSSSLSLSPFHLVAFTTIIAVKLLYWHIEYTIYTALMSILFLIPNTYNSCINRPKTIRYTIYYLPTI